MYFWFTDYPRAKNTHFCSMYLHWEITICSKNNKQFECWGCAAAVGRLVEKHWLSVVAYATPATPDVWVAIVVRQSGIVVLVVLATPPSAHLYQVCERCFWEALSISCEYWQLEEKWALREKCAGPCFKIKKEIKNAVLSQASGWWRRKATWDHLTKRLQLTLH